MAEKRETSKRSGRRGAASKSRTAPARIKPRTTAGAVPEKEERAAPPPAPDSRPDRPAATGIHDLAPARGATRGRKRVGRGPGSGHGKTAGRGNKGQKSRAGYRHQRGFEGGQMPLHRRVPKRGFKNIFRVEYEVVNLSDLDRFEAGASVTPDSLRQMRLVRRERPVKILGDGQLAKALQVSAHKFSASAQAKIEEAGGRCEVLAR